jgi:glucose-6-phosphate-specific signal transduction histidine kinase
LPDAVDPHQPFGLIGMRERVRMLEGTMTIERPRTGGFIVHVILPLSMVDAVPGQRRAQAPLAPKRGKPTS